MKFFQLLFVSIMIELQVKRYVALCQLRWLVISLLLPKLLLYLGKIALIGLELNSEGNKFSFICCAKQRTILLGVPRAWRVLHDHRLSDLEWSFLSTGQNFVNWSNFIQQVATTRNNTQHGVQTLPKCWAQQCCERLHGPLSD